MTDEELRELQELAHQLDELTKHPGWKVLVDFAWNGDGMIGAKQRYLVGGSCKTTDEYQKYAGWVAGAQAVLQAPVAVAAIRDRESEKAIAPDDE